MQQEDSKGKRFESLVVQMTNAHIFIRLYNFQACFVRKSAGRVFESAKVRGNAYIYRYIKPLISIIDHTYHEYN